jgi:MFS family permease
MAQVRMLIGISVFWLSLSWLTDGLNTLILPTMVAERADPGTAATVLGLVTLVGLALALLIQPLAGQVSDQLHLRWGRRGMIVLGSAGALLALVLLGSAPGLVTLAAAYVGLQVCVSIAQAAQQGYIPDLVPGPRRGLASGWKGFMDLAGAMLGFVVIGQLAGSGDPQPALIAVGAALIFGLLLTVVLTREPTRPVPVVERLPGLADAFRLDLRRHHDFVVLVISRFLFLLGTYAVGRFFLYFVADRLGIPRPEAADEAGGLLAGLALITALASPAAGWLADRRGRVPVMVAGSLLGAVGAGLLATAETQGSILLFGGLMALGSGAFATANWAQVADLAPPHEAGRFLGIANLGTGGALAAAGLLGPVLDQAGSASTGYSLLFACAALCMLASAGAPLALSERLRAIPRAERRQDVQRRAS